MPSESPSGALRSSPVEDALSSRSAWRSTLCTETPIFDKIYSKGEIADFWEKYTSLCPGAASLTSKLNLRLLFNTGSGLFKGASCEIDPLVSWSLHNPYSWQCFWPGGQGLARYILDNPQVVKGKRVLEVGSGCGAVSIACALSGAAEVVANDIDPVAIVATELNAFLNGVHEKIQVTSENLLLRYTSELKPNDFAAPASNHNLGVTNLIEISSANSEASSEYSVSSFAFSSSPSSSSTSSSRRWDVVLLGDMQYNDDLAIRVRRWITALKAEGVDVLFGDPGRSTVDEGFLDSESVVRVADFRLPLISKRSHVNPDETTVWRVVSQEEIQMME